MKKTSVIATPTLQEKLIDTAKWAITMVQILGYFPFTVWKGQELRLKVICIQTVSFFVLLLLIVVQNYVFEIYRERLEAAYSNLFTPTETVAYLFVGAISLLSNVVCKVLGCVQFKKTKTYWLSTSELLTKYSYAGFNFYGEDEHVLSKIRQTCKRSAMLVYLGASFQILTVGLLGSEFIFPTKVAIPNITKHIQAFWYGYLYLHAGHCIWILFFIRLYSGFVHLIYKELCKLHERSNDNNVALAESKIRTCISLFYEVENRIELYNKYFGYRIILEVFASSMNALSSTFFGIQLALRFQGLNFGHLSFLIPFLAQVKILNDIGTTVSSLNSEIRNFSRILEKVCEMDISPTLKQKIQMLATRLGSNPPEITASSYFKINRHLIVSVFSTITTYLIIMIQFQNSTKR